MKKIKLGSVEILGYVGIAVWITVIFLRAYPLSESAAYWFWLGILPNAGAAWAATMFAKWLVVFGLKKVITVKLHLMLCIGVLILALVSEMVHALFLNSPFDLYDMLITIAAQLIMFFLPILVKDKCLGGYTGE